jgi:hypothetical protein
MLNRKRKPMKNRIDEMANRLAAAGRTQEIATELERFDPNGLDGPEREAWYHLRGIEAFRKGDRALAFLRFQEARAACPDSGRIAFSLGQEYEQRAEPESMFALFDAHRFPTIPSGYALAQARYAYLWSDVTRARSYVEPILEAHWKLRIADDTFLYLRGMPFFGQTWAYWAAFRELSGDLAAFEKETEEVASKVTDYDVTPMLELIRSIRSNDFSQYVREPRRGTGYERTRAAVLLSKILKTKADAMAALDDVQLGEDDCPWLGDIVLLARAEAAARWNDPVADELCAEFLRRQPLLFEPDHAFNFRLLEWQERLKARYQENKRAKAAELG